MDKPLKRRLLISSAIALGLIIILCASFLPINQWRVMSFGIDSFETHAPLFGTRTVSQTIGEAYPLTGLGFILVDLHRSKQISDVQVIVKDTKTGERLGQATVPATIIKDDTFSRIVFAKPLSSATGSYTIILSAPEATAKTAIGVRFEKPENLALELREKAPAWMMVFHTFARHQQRWQYLLPAIIASFLVVAIAFRLGRQAVPKQYHRHLEWAAIILIVVVASWSRLNIMSQLGGASGGDPYNYLFIAQTIGDGHNPLIGEKRLPGFPLLLVPSLINSQWDQVSYMRLISVASAGLSLVFIWQLARVLNLPWAVQIIAPALIAWQKDFVWTSLRPEPYTFYTALLLGALILFFSAKQWWQQVLYGFLLGYAAMTRQEGFIFAAVLGFLSLLNWKVYNPAKDARFLSLHTAKAYAWLYLPALALVAPFFIHNTASYGNPFFTPYFEGDRLQIVDSWGAFTDSLGATWGIIGSLWRPVWESLERYEFTNPMFLVGFLGTFAWVTYWSKQYALEKKAGWSIWAGVSALTILCLLMLMPAWTSFAGQAPIMIAGITAASSLTILWLLKWPGFVILAVAISQILVATWFHPFVKHYQQSLPLIALALAVAILTPVIMRYRHKLENTLLVQLALAGLTLALVLPFAALSAKTLFEAGSMIDKQNANSAVDSVTYRAVKAALAFPEPYGADQGYNQARLYFRDQGKYYLDEDSTFAEEEKWVKENHIQTMVTTTDGDTFKHAHPNWQQVAHFKSEGRDDRLYESFVYRIPVQ